MDEAPQPQPLQPVAYKPKHWHPLLLGGILIIAVLAGGFIFLYWQHPSPQEISQVPSTTSSQTFNTMVSILDLDGNFGSFFKDAKFVYYQYSPTHTEVISDDPKGFILLEGNYAKDTVHVYEVFQIGIGITILAEADSLTFIVLPAEKYQTRYAKDKDTVFYGTEVIPAADSGTFQTVQHVTGYDAQDKNHKYLQGQIVE